MSCYAVLAVFLCAIAVSNVHSAYKTCPKNWVKKGCRIDDDRGLTTLFDDRKSGNVQIDWNNLYDYLMDLTCRCRAEALKLGNSWFALENYGICFSAKGPIEKFLAKYTLAPAHSCTGALKHNKTIVSDVDGEICVGGVMRAYFYKIINRGARIFHVPQPPEDEAKACFKVADIVLLIDVSGSVGEDNFKKVKEFLQKFIDAFDFGKGKSGSRISIVAFDHAFYTYLTWVDSEAIGKAKIRETLDSVKYNAGSTATDKAIKHIIKSIVKPSQRKNIPKTIFIITDGRCFRGAELLPAPTKELKALGCNVITIGVGEDLDHDELLMLTGGKKENILLFKTFQGLIDRAVNTINKMVTKACV